MRCDICEYVRAPITYEERTWRIARARMMLRRERVLDPHRFHEMVRGLPDDEQELRRAQSMLRPLTPETPDWHRPYASEPVVRSLFENGNQIHALQFWAAGADSQTAHQWLWPVRGHCECWNLMSGTEIQVRAVGDAKDLWQRMRSHHDDFACCLGRAGFPQDGIVVVVSANHWEDPGSQHYRVASVVPRIEDGELVVPATFNQQHFMATVVA